MNETQLPTDAAMVPCDFCGMPCAANEYHPYAACLMFKACHNSKTVRANLEAVRGTPAPVGVEPLTLWIDEVRQYLVAAADSSMSRNNSEQLASELLDQMPLAMGREPLTDEWIRSRCKEPWIFETAKQWVRMAEAAHGIKQGGQHVS